ncbi:hypothetical protein DL93DRAFT_2103330 [Clavulina sp. PMI_390]|nr:hypothetical protein DL93DRAFT_2103330 [Clavulina sp. PMI_390]
MPQSLSNVLPRLAKFFRPGPPRFSLESPIHAISYYHQSIDAITCYLTQDYLRIYPEVYRQYRLRCIAVTKSNTLGSPAHHQSLVFVFEYKHSIIGLRSFHFLVGQRRSFEDYVPDGNESSQSLPSSHNPSETSPDLLSNNHPCTKAHDTFRYWGSSSWLTRKFWLGAQGRLDDSSCSGYQATDGVVFEFRDATGAAPLTFHEVVLAMAAVSLTAPEHDFTAENCWWWAQSVLLLLLRLKACNKDLSLDEIQDRERFVTKLDHPSTVESPIMHHITVHNMYWCIPRDVHRVGR